MKCMNHFNINGSLPVSVILNCINRWEPNSSRERLGGLYAKNVD